MRSWQAEIEQMVQWRVVQVLLASAGAGLPAAAAEAATPTLCVPPEVPAFSCQVARGRTLALCTSADKSVRYRFGRAGAIELHYTAGTLTGGQPMWFAHYFRYQTDRVEVRFEHQGTEYTVFDYREDGRRQAGVRVMGAGAREREIPCTGPITGRLGVLEDVLPCDTNSGLNLGNCK